MDGGHVQVAARLLSCNAQCLFIPECLDCTHLGSVGWIAAFPAAGKVAKGLKQWLVQAGCVVP